MEVVIPINAYQNQPIGVFGLGRSGLAAAQALAAGGAEVLAWDDDPEMTGTNNFSMQDLYQADLSKLSALVVAPGVRLDHSLLTDARRSACTIVGDIELFQLARRELPAHQLVAVTGTNGKSTTTALLGHVLAMAQLPVAVGGNIGIPVLALQPLPTDGIYVFEISSFQLDLTSTLEADVAILLNLTPDHLDRHGSFEAYAGAKARLFGMQRDDQIAVISVDDENCRSIAAKLNQTVVPVSVADTVEMGVSVVNGTLWDGLGGKPSPVSDILGCPALKGSHNWQNAAAVYAAARVLGVPADTIIKAFETFPGLPHRLQPVVEAADVLFVNDSKASNPDAASKALAAYEDIYWIAGGRLKGTPEFDGLAAGLEHVRKAYLIGEAADIFGAFLARKIPFENSQTIVNAVENAAKDAAAAGGGVVLLAPAAASFDQFENFEMRGDAFIDAARTAATSLGTKEGN
jgi:UDP-N-acetylmuramoylalanine--D-glutamate ligase